MEIDSAFAESISVYRRMTDEEFYNKTGGTDGVGVRNCVYVFFFDHLFFTW